MVRTPPTEEGRFNRLAATLLLVVGVVDVVAGLAFGLLAGRFGYDPFTAWIAGGLFIFFGVGMLAFLAIQRRRH